MLILEYFPRKSSRPKILNFIWTAPSAIGRLLSFCVVIFIASHTANAQSLGYVPNLTDGTVTIFATGPDPNGGDIVDSVLKTVTVCTSPTNAAVTPDSNHVYVTCAADNALWSIDVTNIAQGTATAQNVSGIQLFAPGGVATSTLTAGVNAGKTLAYIVNSQTNTVSVIDTANNTLFDGPIQLGASPTGGTDTVVASGLVAVAPDTTKVFVTINNPTPQLWMIDTTIKPETAIQIQAVGFPAAATGSLYLSVQNSLTSSDYYVLITTSAFTGGTPVNPEMLLIGVEPGAPAGTTGSPSNAFLTAAPLGTSQPNHVISLVTSSTEAGLPFISAATVDNTNIWVVSFDCAGGTPPSCSVSSFNPTPVAEPGTPPPALNGLGLAYDPNSQSLPELYVTDGHPNGLVKAVLDVDLQTLAPLASTVQVGNGALAPVFSPISVTSAPIVFFTGTSVAGTQVNATGVSLVNPLNATSVLLSFGANNIFQCNQSNNPCTSGAAQVGAAGVGGGTTLPSSGIFTVILTGTGTNGNGGALPSGQATEQVIVGANCTLGAAGISPGVSNIAVGQQVTVTLACLAPPGDDISGTLNWGDGTVTSPTGQTVVAGANSTASLMFTHSYASPNTYVVSIASLSDISTESTGAPSGGPVNVTVNPLSISVSPPAVSIQTSKSVTLAAAVQFDPSNSGVSWALSGSACFDAACGTLSNVTTTSVAYTAPAVVPKGSTISLTATANASVSYADAMKSFTVPITLTAVTSPSCVLTAPSQGQTSLSVTTTITCTAPSGDSVSATVNWGDGSNRATSTATADSKGSLTFPPFTHTYASASNPSFSIGVSVIDNTTQASGGTTPPSVVITVLKTPAVTPQGPTTITVIPGQPAILPFTFDGGPGDAGVTFDSVTCAVAPTGPSCTVMPMTLTLDANGKGTVQVTVNTVGPSTALLLPQSNERFSSSIPPSAALLWLMTLALGILAVASDKRRQLALPVLLMACFALFLQGCGSSVQRSNLACTTCTTAQSYTVTVTATSKKPILSAQGTFTVVVQM